MGKMKLLSIPSPRSDFYNADEIQTTLDGYHKKESKRGNILRRLTGIYRLIRQMSKHSGLGDFIVLSQCVDWLKVNNQEPKKSSIRRCLLYFQPLPTQKERMELAETFFNDGGLLATG